MVRSQGDGDVEDEVINDEGASITPTEKVIFTLFCFPLFSASFITDAFYLFEFGVIYRKRAQWVF